MRHAQLGSRVGRLRATLRVVDDGRELLLLRFLALLLFGYRFGVAVSAHSSGAQPSLFDAGRADITTWPNPIKLLR